MSTDVAYVFDNTDFDRVRWATGNRKRRQHEPDPKEHARLHEKGSSLWQKLIVSILWGYCRAQLPTWMNFGVLLHLVGHNETDSEEIVYPLFGHSLGISLVSG